MFTCLITNQIGTSGETVLNYYGSILLEDYTNVFDFCNEINSLVNHFLIYLALAIRLRTIIVEELKEEAKKDEKLTEKIPINDVEIDADYEKSIKDELNKQYDLVVKKAQKICNLFNEFEGIPVLFQHLPNQGVLTGYKNGNAQSTSKPFESYDYHILGASKSHKIGMPQIFVNSLVQFSIEKYYTTLSSSTVIGAYYSLGSSGSSGETHNVNLHGKLQKWILHKKNENRKTVFMIQHQDSGLFLDGFSKEGTAYLSGQNDSNLYLRWEPIFTKNPSPHENEDQYFILRNVGSKKVLDSDCIKVYACGDQNLHDNIYVKWRLITDTLFDGEYLKPNQSLFSMNEQIRLTYQKDGVLVLFDQANNKELWRTKPSKLVAWRCCIQKDRNFVTYAGENDPTWASNKYSPENDYSCKLTVQNDGKLVVNCHWEKKSAGSSSSSEISYVVNE